MVFSPLMTSAPLTAASNSYIVKVGGQSTILSPGSSTQLQYVRMEVNIKREKELEAYLKAEK